MSIPCYLVLGTPQSGRRPLVGGVVKNAMGEGDFCAVFVSGREAPSSADAGLENCENAEFVRYDSPDDALEKLSSLDESRVTNVFFVADSHANLADQIEDFSRIVKESPRIRLARIWGVLDCAMLARFPKECEAYADAVSHFADCLLLSNRTGNAANKAANDVVVRYRKMCRPHLVEMLDKHFCADNPMEILVEEARRITMVFDEFSPEDDLDFDDIPDEPFSLERKPDPYLEAYANGIRKKPVPDVLRYACDAHAEA